MRRVRLDAPFFLLVVRQDTPYSRLRMLPLSLWVGYLVTSQLRAFVFHAAGAIRTRREYEIDRLTTSASDSFTMKRSFVVNVT
jgi:hypothetical protein